MELTVPKISLLCPKGLLQKNDKIKRKIKSWNS